MYREKLGDFFFKKEIKLYRKKFGNIFRVEKMLEIFSYKKIFFCIEKIFGDIFFRTPKKLETFFRMEKILKFNFFYIFLLKKKNG